MGLGDVWNRTLVYFGIAEEDDWDEDGYATNEELERSYEARERPNVAPSPRRARARLRRLDRPDAGESSRTRAAAASTRRGVRPCRAGRR